MITREEIKAMSMLQQIRTNAALMGCIETNDIEQVKEFLQEYPLQESFYENHFKGDNERFPLFSVVDALARAAIVYEKYKSPAMLEFLQEYGLKIDYNTNHNGDSHGNALVRYIDLGGKDEVVIKYLLDKGLTCDVVGDEERAGRTPIHNWAAYDSWGTEKLRVAITKAGANVDVKDSLGYTPLFKAVYFNCNCEVAQTLIELGANVNYYCRGSTPLDEARTTEVKKILRAAGAKSASSEKIKKIIDEAYLAFDINRASPLEYYEKFSGLPEEQKKELNRKLDEFINQKILEMMNKEKAKPVKKDKKSTHSKDDTPQGLLEKYKSNGKFKTRLTHLSREEQEEFIQNVLEYEYASWDRGELKTDERSHFVFPPRFKEVMEFEKAHFKGAILSDFIKTLEERLQQEEMELYDNPADFEGGDYYDKETSNCDENYTIEDWVEDQTADLRALIDTLKEDY